MVAVGGHHGRGGGHRSVAPAGGGRKRGEPRVSPREPTRSALRRVRRRHAVLRGGGEPRLVRRSWHLRVRRLARSARAPGASRGFGCGCRVGRWASSGRTPGSATTRDDSIVRGSSTTSSTRRPDVASRSNSSCRTTVRSRPTSNSEWAANPYNAANGGPLASPAPVLHGPDGGRVVPSASPLRGRPLRRRHQPARLGAVERGGSHRLVRPGRQHRRGTARWPTTSAASTRPATS